MPIPTRPPGFPYVVPGFYINITLGAGAPPRREYATVTGEQLDQLQDLLHARPVARQDPDVDPDDLDRLLLSL